MVVSCQLALLTISFCQKRQGFGHSVRRLVDGIIKWRRITVLTGDSMKVKGVQER